jgi:drug/metabolite transporter (DMT)-like permease
VRGERTGYGLGLLAAVLFGISAPASKGLLDDVGPQMLAGLLYLGAFLAIAPLALLSKSRREAGLRRSDGAALAGLVLSGGIVAPVLLMIGLERVSGIAGSLLLNLEGPFTLVVGVVALHEYLSGRSWIGAATVFGASAVLTTHGASGSNDALGCALIAAACLGWAVDNNLTQRLTVRDPFQIVAVKTGVAGTVNVGLAALRGESVDALAPLFAALALGALAYGISILVDAYALRLLGAARESAMFATAPFAGALLAVPLLGESWAASELVAVALMVTGIVLLVGDRHAHRHAHVSMEHDHRHVHDEHHQHPHPPGVDPTEPHSHPHRHEGLVHSHPHVSDTHHRHQHRGEESNRRRSDRDVRPRHRVNVRWVTPPGVETTSTSYCCSNASRPSHSRTPRPSRIGTCTTCRWSTRPAAMNARIMVGPPPMRTS